VASDAAGLFSLHPDRNVLLKMLSLRPLFDVTHLSIVNRNRFL
jgi:hypothetical protein